MKGFKEWLNESKIESFSNLGINRVYHSGGISSYEDIDPFRLASKQNKKGRNYGGFYVGSYDHAKSYPGEHFLEITIDPAAKVLLGGMVDRIDVNDLKNYANQGIDMIWGKDIRGLDQGIIINKSIINNIKNTV